MKQKKTFEQDFALLCVRHRMTAAAMVFDHSNGLRLRNVCGPNNVVSFVKKALEEYLGTEHGRKPKV